MDRRLQRLTAWLGVLAILLAVFVPLGSQLLARQAQPNTILCSATGHETHGPADNPVTSDHHLDACGYCSLLAHCPALNCDSCAEAVAPSANVDAPQTRPVDAYRTPKRYRLNPSRAPPSAA